MAAMARIPTHRATVRLGVDACGSSDDGAVAKDDEINSARASPTANQSPVRVPSAHKASCLSRNLIATSFAAPTCRREEDSPLMKCSSANWNPLTGSLLFERSKARAGSPAVAGCQLRGLNAPLRADIGRSRSLAGHSLC